MMEPTLGQFYLPLVVMQEVVQELQDLFLKEVVSGLGGFFILLLQCDRVKL